MKETNKIGNGLLIYFGLTFVYSFIALIIGLDINNSYNYLLLSLTCFLGMYFYFKNFKEVKKEKINIKKTFLYGIILLGITCFGSIFIEILNKLISLTGYSFTGENLSVFKTESLYDFAIMFIYVVLLAPVTEEFIFRGFILETTKKYGKVFSIIFAAVAFGIFHMEFMQIIPAIISGIFLGYLYIKYNSIYVPIIAHMINNMVAIIINQFNVNELLFNVIFVFIGLITFIFLNKKEKIFKIVDDKKEKYNYTNLIRSISFIVFVLITIIYTFATFKQI